MRKTLLYVLAIGMVSVTVSDAPAGVSYVSQTRSVRSQAGPDVQTISAPDLGVFSADANAAATSTNTIATAQTTMESSLLQTGLFFSGKQALSVALAFPGAGSETGFGADTLIEGSVKFTIDQPYAFKYTSTRTVNEATGSLDGDNAHQFLGPDSAIGGVNAIPASGIILPGEYTFSFVEGSFNSVVQTNSPGTLDRNYVISLELTPVPLPPAIWMALSTLGGIVSIGYLRRRRADRAELANG